MGSVLDVSEVEPVGGRAYRNVLCSDGAVAGRLHRRSVDNLEGGESCRAMVVGLIGVDG